MSKAKKATEEYHNDFYQRAELFEKGSWLEESEELLLEIVTKHFGKKENIQVLDLGCGVGRNAIPVAKIVKPNGGRVMCIDFLDIAIKKLKQNAEKHGVLNIIDAQVQDIESYLIKPAYFDLIIAYSVLEHGVSNKEGFFRVIESIQSGVKKDGINFFGVTTNLQELDAETLEPLPEDIEFKATYTEAKNIFENIYKDWEIICEDKSFFKERYVKNGRMIIWQSDFLTFAAKKK